MPKPKPTLHLFAGSNGAGKTTFAQIEIHYLWLPSPVLALRRIAQRVKMGGHSVPATDVKRRFSRSLTNFLEIYAPLADNWTFRNNSSQPPSLLFDSANSKFEQVSHFLRQ
jgi:predicted ABC-type ATPase